MKVLEWFVAVLGIMLALALCVACSAGLAWIAQQLPLSGAPQRAVVMLAALAGIGLALLVMKKALGERRL